MGLWICTPLNTVGLLPDDDPGELPAAGALFPCTGTFAAFPGDTPLEVVGETFTKLTGTVAVDDGALPAVVGLLTTPVEIGFVEIGDDVMLPPVKDVAPLEGV